MADQKGRKLDQRKTDVLAALNKQADLWLATADMTGRPHLIAISAWWDGAKSSSRRPAEVGRPATSNQRELPASPLAPLTT